MKALTALVILTGLLVPPLLAADPAPPVEQAAEAKSAQDQLKESPDSVEALNRYMIEKMRSLSTLVVSDPDEAEKVLQSMQEFLGSLEQQEEGAKQLKQRALDAVDFYQQRIELSRTTLEELEQRLNEKPDDAKSIQMYISKATQEIYPLAGPEPDQAEQQLAKVTKFLEDLKAKTQDEAAKKAIEGSTQAFSRLNDAIERGKRLAALIGSDAAPLTVEAWATGEPISDDQLKGKVVLLDFWAVWCGPCIATFPHLREWQEKYADKGLVIIGLTRYYNYAWDETAKQAKRSQEKVSPEVEREALAKFAESHDLHHRIAIQKDNSLSEFYGVTGIPHVVLIDRQGKIRMMRVGSGEQNAKDLQAMIETLIAAGAES